jgi:outer membrane immunogenic protein
MRTSLRSFCTIAAALGCAGLAHAADLPVRYPVAPVAPAPIYVPIYNWTGFYLGINGGGGWGTSQWDGIDKFDISGGLIGGTVGYNWQFGQVVVGAEGDVDWSSIKGTTVVNCALGCSTRNDWLATVRGRVGYAFNRFLPYLTAGLAVGDINATVPNLPAGSITKAGWTVGFGLEAGIVSNVSVKAEYLYFDLGSFNCGFNCGLAGTGNVSLAAHTFRAGLNVRF